MFTKYSHRVTILATELVHSKYFAMDAAPDVRIRLATEAAIRQANREREARRKLIDDLVHIGAVFALCGIIPAIVFLFA